MGEPRFIRARVAAYSLWGGLSTFWKIVIVLTPIISVMGVLALLPQIGIAPGASLDKKDPLEMRFFATNHSVYPLYNVHYVCIFRPKGPANTNLIHLDPGLHERMDAGVPLSLWCGDKNWHVEGVLGAWLAVNVMYELPFWKHEFDHGELFFMKRDVDGGAQWFPTGVSSGMAENLKYILSHEPP